MRKWEVASVFFIVLTIALFGSIVSAAEDPEILGVEDGGLYNEPVTITTSFDEASDAQIEILKDGNVFVSEKSSDEGSSVESIQNFSEEISEDGEYKVTLEIEVTTITPPETEGEEPTEETKNYKTEKSFTIDAEKPELTLSLSGTKYNDTEWYTDDVTVDVSAGDESSGLESLSVSLNGEEFYSGAEETKQIVLKKEDLMKETPDGGKYSISAEASDKAGNIAEETAEFLFDAESPDVAFSGIDNGSIINKAREITLSAEDNVAPVKVYLDIKRNGTIISSVSKEDTKISCLPEENGEYELTGYAEDAAGNISKPVTTKFMLDTVDPVIAGFSHSGNKVHEGAWYNGDVKLSAFVSDDLSGLLGSEIKVNDETVSISEFSGETEKTLSKTIAEKWISENESPDGKYNAVLSAEDRAGNRTERNITFYADVKKPKISISGVEKGIFTSKTPTIKAKVSDNYADLNTIYINVQRNGSPYRSETFKNSSKASFGSFGADGHYTLTAWCVDKAGNRSSEESISFTKDTTAPVIALSGAKEGSYYNTSKVISAAIKELNYKGVTVSAKVTRELDGKTENISWTITPGSANYKTAKRFSRTGTYKLTVEAVDKAGNKANPKSLSFTIDTEKPEVKISGIKKAVGYNDSIAPKIEYKDDYYESSAFKLSFTGGKADSSYKDTKTKKGGSRSYSGFAKTNANDGTYTLSCTVKDKAGNVTSKTEVFRINRFGSKWRVSKQAQEISGRIVKEIDTGFVVTEENVTGLTDKKPKITLDGEAMNDARIKIKETVSANHIYRYGFDKRNFDREGSYVCSVSSTDTMGNYSELPAKKQIRFIVDKTPPVITLSGISKNGTYEDGKGLVKVNVSDNFAVKDYSVFIDNKIVYESKKDDTSSTIDVPNGKGMTIRVVANDKAENRSVEAISNVTVSDGSFISGIGAGKIIPAAAALILAAAAAFVIKRRRS